MFRVELISKALHGEDKFRLFRIFFQFLAQAGDMHVHRAGVHVRTVPPNLLQQFLARKRCAAVFDEISKKLEFAGGQIHNLSVPGRFGSHKVHMNGSKVNPPVCTTGRLGARLRSASTRAISSSMLNGFVT